MKCNVPVFVLGELGKNGGNDRGSGENATAADLFTLVAEDELDDTEELSLLVVVVVVVVGDVGVGSPLRIGGFMDIFQLEMSPSFLLAHNKYSIAQRPHQVWSVYL
jgi:hypothetical protein